MQIFLSHVTLRTSYMMSRIAETTEISSSVSSEVPNKLTTHSPASDNNTFSASLEIHLSSSSSSFPNFYKGNISFSLIGS